jgi:hypothetical protein
LKTTYNSDIQFNSSGNPHIIAIPRNIMVSISTAVHEVRSHSAGNTDDESSAKKKGDYDALAECEIESEDYWDRDEDDTEIIDDAQDALDQEMDLLVEAALWHKRQSPIC